MLCTISCRNCVPPQVYEEDKVEGQGLSFEQVGSPLSQHATCPISSL